jgi:hypothetical protein
MFFTVVYVPTAAWACGSCAGIVDSLVYGQDFGINLVRMLGPIIVIILIAFAIHHFADGVGTGDRDD